MTAAEIAGALGVAHRSGAWWRARCPVHSSRSATLALRDGEHGLIVHCHAGCDWRDLLAELRRRRLLAGRADDAPSARTAEQRQWAPPLLRRDDDASRILAARRIWDAARETRGSPVVGYLAGRALDMPPPSSLRYAPALHRPDGACGPAMVALVEHVERGVVGVHRTWFTCDPAGIWRRRDRATLGPIRGGAVRLGAAAETLLIAEGVETTAAGMVALALPGWATMSAGGMVALVLPPEARNIVILADNDANGTGERAALTAAQRWLAEGRQVQIVMPGEIGTDINDVLLAGEESHNVAA